MRSLRIDPELDSLVRQAAAAEDSSVSEFARRALAERAEKILSQTTSTRERLADVIGVVHGGGGRARQTGRAFTEVVAERVKRK